MSIWTWSSKFVFAFLTGFSSLLPRLTSDGKYHHPLIEQGVLGRCVGFADDAGPDDKQVEKEQKS